MRNIDAKFKGLLTGLLMVISSLFIYFLKGNFENNLQYVTYAIYVAGILWTLNDYKKQGVGPTNFKGLFSQGFRCFIIVTFIMVTFTWIFVKLHPSLKDEMAVHYKEELSKSGNYTAPEIDAMVVKAKDYFLVMLTSMAIFGYLVIGSIVTLLGSAVMADKNKNNPTFEKI